MRLIVEPTKTQSTLYIDKNRTMTNLSHQLICASATNINQPDPKEALGGAELHSMAKDYYKKKNQAIDEGFNLAHRYKRPISKASKLVYGLAMISPFIDGRQPHTGARYRESLFSSTESISSPNISTQGVLPYYLLQGSGRPSVRASLQEKSRRRLKREAAPHILRARTDWQFRLALYLNRNTAAGIDPATVDDRQLAIKMLSGVEQTPAILPELARLTLYGSQLYGERRGESLSALQQSGLIGQALCQLIYQEDNIALRIAKIFAGGRHITQQAFMASIQSWPYSNQYAEEKRLWQKNFEAPEIPSLYLNSLYSVQDSPQWMNQSQIAILDLDYLWVGSLTWTLLHIGARSLVLENPARLKSASLQTLIEVGIGLLGMFRQGVLSSDVETTMYLGLLLYYLRACPGLSLEQILTQETLEPAFELLKKELETRHLVARQLYDSFVYYQVGFKTTSWRARTAAAEELLTLHCADAISPLRGDDDQIAGDTASQHQDQVRRMMSSPAGQRCQASGAPIPDLDDYYRREVDRFAEKIRALDSALLAAAFLPSDVQDDNFQFEDARFLPRAEIDWVMPRLMQHRRVPDMFYSNKPIQYFGKPDTFFFQARQYNDSRLFALRTTSQGYVLRKIPLNDKYLSGLMPFMAEWPFPALVPQHEFSLLPVNGTELMKRANETLVLFHERYAEAHYQAYRLKIYEAGYQSTESSLKHIVATVSGYIIPFYGCVGALRSGEHQAAFSECLVDGAMVGLPLVFTGMKAGLGLFREAGVGVGRTLSGPRFSASGQQVFRNVVPATVQIAGGVTATQAQLSQFTTAIGLGLLKSVDPGISTLKSLSILTNGLCLALLSRTTAGVIAWQRNLAKVSEELTNLAAASNVLDFQVAYNREGDTPLTVTAKGTTYPVIQIQNSSMVGVETGERTPGGQLLFAQLDLQSRLGVYKKYYCLDLGSARCHVTHYILPDYKIEKNAVLSRAAESQVYWLLTGNSPIFLVVVHPLSLLNFADSKWVLFEINEKRWALSRDNGTLISADNIDDWQVEPQQGGDVHLMMEASDSDRAIRLCLPPLPHRNKREISYPPSVLDWHHLLVNYTLAEEETVGFNALIHDGSQLNVQIGEQRYLLLPEKNAATFLLRHPIKQNAPAFRLSYRVDKGDFVFASPLEPLNAHRLGEFLRVKITHNRLASQEPFINLLLPPLVNGAFRYGNTMFLKFGERMLSIALFNGLYHTLSMDDADDKKANKYWTLRYELFTGSFDIINIGDHPALPDWGLGSPPSRFEKLAARTFSKSQFPTLPSLCRLGNQTAHRVALADSLHTRLRQVALLLRLDPPRRAEILHASSAAMRTFEMDKSLPAEWIVNFQPLALWATLVNTVTRCLPTRATQTSWASRQLALIEGLSLLLPGPRLIGLGPDLRLFIISEEAASEGATLQKNYEVTLYPDRMEAEPLLTEDELCRWLPNVGETLPTSVTRYALSEGQQPMFWVDTSQQIWAETPDGVKTRLYRQSANHPVDDIVVSPDGDIVVLVVERSAHRLVALYYHLPPMGSQDAGKEREPFEDAQITGEFVFSRASWVTNQGELYVPWVNHWSFLEEDHPRWATPEGFHPDFVSPDQRFLGYVKRNDEIHDHEILLLDTTNNNHLILRRGQPVGVKSYGLGKIVSVAFSALNALAAVGFADGYIEIYRIGIGEDAAGVLSLGFARVPMGQYILKDSRHPIPKQMVMKFTNAFDRLLVFHDIGELGSDQQGNGTYAVSEIFLANPAGA